MLNAKQLDLVREVCRQRGFKNPSIQANPGSKKGDGYLGNILLITVKEQQQEESYILKCAETNEIVRQQMPIREAYVREIYVYRTLLPALKAFQEKYPVKYPFTSYARLLGCVEQEGEECLLMENIRSLGFEMMDRKKPMGESQVTCVFKQLAKLHSISLAMNQLEPATYERLTENLDDYFAKNDKIMEAFANAAEQHYQTALGIVGEDEQAKVALARWRHTLEDIFMDMSNNHENQICIVHGDSWCNNMMFKYDNKNLSGMCFLDWQLCKINAPVLDLQYFFVFSSSKPILDDYKRYLHIYHEILEENLHSVGCDCKKLMPLERLEDLWKKYSNVILFVALSNMHLHLRDESEVKTFVDVVAEGKSDIMKSLMERKELSGEGRKRLHDIIYSFIQGGCF